MSEKNEHLDPNPAKALKEMELPKFQKFIIDILEPRCTMDRILKLLPSVRQSNTLMLEPSCHEANKDIAASSRTVFLIEQVDPILIKSTHESAEPNRANALNDADDPRVNESNTESD